MFGQNEIVGLKYFKEAPKNSLLVTSIFITIQGEGPFAGHPALFIRLAKCNLNCSFCDTYFDSGDWLDFNQLNEKIEKAFVEFEGDLQAEDTVLVVTGGEPMLQGNLSEFLTDYGSLFKRVQIESNGIHTQDLPPLTTLVISPKCAEKNGAPTKYLKTKEEVLLYADCLKFIVSADPKSPYHTVPGWVKDWKRDYPDRTVYISPMNMYTRPPIKLGKDLKSRSAKDEVISFWEPGLLDRELNQKNHEYAAKYCLQNGFNLNLQMHLYASLA